MARDGDVVLCMGAGSIGAVAAEVVALGASEVARLQEATA
jgi:UDP-N-acetylmuramate--alanine ligase